jgi:hypothetical protein
MLPSSRLDARLTIQKRRPSASAGFCSRPPDIGGGGGGGGVYFKLSAKVVYDPIQSYIIFRPVLAM